jgi:antitoxin component YwqK of YwqJK toxin-antitoxin module
MLIAVYMYNPISMKKIALIILLFSVGKAFAQQSGDYTNNRPGNYSNSRVNSSTKRRVTNNNIVLNDDGFSQVRIIDSTQQIRADILPLKSSPKIKNDRYYYWYLDNVIHSTQGGYNGQLLNGHYTAFYPDKNLKEEGDFKSGLKEGEWKTWNPKGDLKSVTNWRDGVMVPDSQQPFWKKIPLLNKKDD